MQLFLWYQRTPLGIPRDVQDLVHLLGRLYVVHAFVFEPGSYKGRCNRGRTFLIHVRSGILPLASQLRDILCRRRCEDI